MSAEDIPLVAVASFATPLEAHLIKGLLEAEGLRVWIADEHLVSANSALAYAMGGVKLLVRAPHRERAMRILAAQRRGDYMLGDESETGDDDGPSDDSRSEAPGSALAPKRRPGDGT